MKYLVTIILSLSLYAPQVARFLAYAECSALALTATNKYWCDCMLTTDTDVDGIPATEKQKDIQLKTDWKFKTEHQYMMDVSKLEASSGSACLVITSLPSPFQMAVFRPPLV